MGIVYPNFPTVDRPHEPVHVHHPIAAELLPGGSTLCTYLPALEGDPCFVLTYQDRDRYSTHEFIYLPRDGIRQAIAVLQRTLDHLEGGAA